MNGKYREYEVNWYENIRRMEPGMYYELQTQRRDTRCWKTKKTLERLPLRWDRPYVACLDGDGDGADEFFHTPN
jgi:hypothetical protein